MLNSQTSIFKISNPKALGVGGMSHRLGNAPRQGPADNGVSDFGACAGAMTNVMP